jgi:hypothetical protein
MVHQWIQPGASIMQRRDGYAAIAYLAVLVAATFCLGVLIADEGDAVPDVYASLIVH